MKTDTGQVKTADVKNKPWKIVIDIVVVLPALKVHKLGEIEEKNNLPPKQCYTTKIRREKMKTKQQLE